MRNTIDILIRRRAYEKAQNAQGQDIGVMRDRHGNVIQDAVPDESLTVYAVAPVSSEEESYQRSHDQAAPDRGFESLDVYAPLGTEIHMGDKIILSNGLLYDVMGPPKVWDRNPLARTGRLVGGIVFRIGRRFG